MKAGRVVRIVLVLAVIGGLGWGGYRVFAGPRGVLAVEAPSVPTTKIVSGPLDLAVFGTGELRATKTIVISAPAVGGTLRLTTVPSTGDAVHADDVILEFDPTEQQYQLEVALSELAEAEQTVLKMRADNEVQASQDKVTMLTARFDVRRAQMDATPMGGLMAANDVERRRLALEEAQRRLTQTEDDLKARAETVKAQTTSVDLRRARSKANADRAQMAILSLAVKAPMDGLIVIRENRDSAGMMGYPGISMPEYRAGDNVMPGRPVADIYDIAQIEIRSRVNEEERANITVGQPATVFSNALPGVVLTAKVSAIAGLAAQTSSPLREFDMTLTLDAPDPRLRPGTSVRLIVQGSHVDKVLHLPRQAVFEKDGKSIVYVRAGDRFEVHEVKVVQRTESRAIIEGLAEGTEVALLNPEIAARMKSSKTGSSPQPPK